MIELGLIGVAGMIATTFALPFFSLHGNHHLSLYVLVSMLLLNFGFICGPPPEDDSK
jgi:hypothetical protein